MTAFANRRAQDVAKLRQLEAGSSGRIKITRISGEPPSSIQLELRFKTAGSKAYPSAVQEVTRVNLSLPARYPFVGPAASIETPIWHPNVFPGGNVCLGMKWLPTEGLELLVKRIIQIITYDASILNEASPANGGALSWYREAKQRHPASFPTDHATMVAADSAKKMKWNEVSADGKVVVRCPSCSAGLRLPAHKSGTVKCPTCSHVFEAKT